MAYVNIYYAEWASPKNLQGYLYIDKLDYIGDPAKLLLKADSLSINYMFDDWNNPIIGMQCEFDIVNDKLDFYELLPLLTAEEKEYKIRVVVTYPTSYTLFEGYLNCDIITQKMLHRQIIKFAASSYLSKLGDIHPASIDILQNLSFIDVIDEILRSAGAEYNIRVNSKLHAEGDTLLPGQTLFNANGFYTEIFWEDDVTRTSSLDILKAILISFDCYIYWWRGFWYIERYEDIWSESVDYVEYTTGQSYFPVDVSSVVNLTQEITDLHDLKFLNQSQTLSIIPGLKTIKINLEDKRVFNLVLSDLTNAVSNEDPVPEPDYRTFMKWEHSLGGGLVETDLYWLDAGKPKSNIVNSINRIMNSTVSPIYRGLTTTFKVTVDKEDVSCNIKFRYFIEPTTIIGWTKQWKDYSIDFNWYLRIAGTNYYIVQSGEDWVTSLGASSGVIDGDNGQMQLINIAGSSFDPLTKTVEVSITVPLGIVKTLFGSQDTGPLTGDQTFVFGLGLERLHVIEEEDIEGIPVNQCWIGDINITSSGGIQNNVIEGTVNTHFLNKKDISMILYDMDNYNYKNGILRGETFLVRTERWGVLGGTNNIIEKGVCWSTSSNPTISDSKTNEGTGFAEYVSLLTGLVSNTLYYVRAYYKDADGTVTYGNELTFTTELLQIGVYHGGGIIFYILKSGDEGYDPLIKKGLIAAVKDQSTGVMWAGGRSTTNAVHQRIGFGKANTDLMDADWKAAPYACAICLDYEADGFTDWYMPTIRELVELWRQRDIIKGFEADWYWSSSEANQFADLSQIPPDLGPVSSANKRAWCFNFKNNGIATGEYNLNPLHHIDYYDKTNHMRIRAIRSFEET